MSTTEAAEPTTAGRARRRPRTDHTGDYALLLQEVREAGLLRRRVGWYAALFVGLCLVTVALVAAAVWIGSSWWALVVAAGLGVVLAQFAFLSHEAGHRAIFASGPRNDRFAQVIGSLVVGGSMSAWGRKHVRHHAHPNQLGSDSSVDPGAFVFRREDASARRGLAGWYTRRQGWFLFPVLTLAGLDIYIEGWRAVLSRGRVPGRWVELPLLVVRHVGLLAVLLWFLPLPEALLFLVVQTAVFGLAMGSAFVPNHVGMPLVPVGAKIDYLHRQVLTSRNVRGGRWATVWMGGLDFQIEHHLFPSMARPCLARAAAITRRFCADRGITYTQVSPVAAYGAVIRELNEVGLGAGRRFECPTAQVMGRP